MTVFGKLTIKPRNRGIWGLVFDLNDRFGLTSGIRRADQTTGGGLLVQDQVLHRRKSAVSPFS
ncbi:hypothetical protein [Falsiruegeria litorea]|uniref:hypothetical protein n=1 Tax=Falsiruegeria litorea TaxID=1280831 RepID=UPI001BFD2186|nr:hypothetical protein [Falsiruegeria litorea]MBT8166786.1 hypothetical protein [Falsiruegeria litorea]